MISSIYATSIFFWHYFRLEFRQLFLSGYSAHISLPCALVFLPDTSLVIVFGSFLTSQRLYLLIPTPGSVNANSPPSPLVAWGCTNHEMETHQDSAEFVCWLTSKPLHGDAHGGGRSTSKLGGKAWSPWGLTPTLRPHRPSRDKRWWLHDSGLARLRDGIVYMTNATILVFIRSTLPRPQQVPPNSTKWFLMGELKAQST